MQTLEPVLNYPPELLLQAQGIRVVFFDVDGVLTDGGLYFNGEGESLKRFSVLDGQGLSSCSRRASRRWSSPAATRRRCACA